jgi:hypothetical protein
MRVQPSLVLEEPPQGYRDLKMLIPLRACRHRAREPEHLAAQFNKFRVAVEVFWDALSVGTGHDAHPGAGESVTELSVTENCRGRGGDGPSCFGSFPSPWSILLTSQNNRPKKKWPQIGGTEATTKESPWTVAILL